MKKYLTVAALAVVLSFQTADAARSKHKSKNRY